MSARRTAIPSIRSRLSPRVLREERAELGGDHSKKIIRRFELDVFSWIGKKPIATIRSADLLDLLRRVEQ